jgi:anaerobic magnesium-protoporphyrin IX monomethyl ester cyclase
MRVALVRYHDYCTNTRQLASMQKRAGVLPHLGLAYIHSALKKAGHTVMSVDAPPLHLDEEGLRRRLLEFMPDLVGVTTTTPGFPGALEACRVAKGVGAKVIIGGPHTEVFAKENLVHDCIDYVGVGEGATIMVELADRLGGVSRPKPAENVKSSSLPILDRHAPATHGTIQGLVTRDSDGGIAPMVNLETLGWPERESMPMYSYHSIIAAYPFTTMISSRGCPFQCSFCFKQSVDKKSIFRSPEDVVGEMIYLRERWGIREIMFYDDIFTMKRSRVFEICDLILRKNLRIRWEAPTRVDLVDQELLNTMARAGCVRLRFGIESGSEELLKMMKKESDIGVIRDAVAQAKRANISTFGYFIVGYLGETVEQYNQTVDLAMQLPLDYATFYTATPLPGTKLHAQAVERGLVPADYWLRYVQGSTSERLSFLVPNAEERARKAYRKFYFRRAKVGTLIKHMATPKRFWAVTSGLSSLLRSNTNKVRDM